MITVKMAGLTVGIDNKYPYLETLAKDFLSDGVPDFEISVTDSEIEAERLAHTPHPTHGYAEAIAVYSKIAEILPKYDAFLIHGAAFSVGDTAHIITAPSGTGKTTHLSLWQSEFSDVSVINGDKPILRFFDGVPHVSGTPWRGKENIGTADTVRLESISYLSRAEENSVSELLPQNTAELLLQSVYIPKRADMMAKLLSLLDKTLGCVRAYSINCNMNPDAAKLARRVIIGEKNDVGNK